MQQLFANSLFSISRIFYIDFLSLSSGVCYAVRSPVKVYTDWNPSVLHQPWQCGQLRPHGPASSKLFWGGDATFLEGDPLKL